MATSKRSVRSTAVRTAVAAGMPLARDLWDTINANGRAEAAVRSGYRKARETAASHTTLGRLELTVDRVLAYAENSDSPQAHRWREEARDIRSRIPLVRMQRGKQRRASVSEMQERADRLLAEILETH